MFSYPVDTLAGRFHGASSKIISDGEGLMVDLSFMLDKLDEVYCDVLVEKELASCEHSAQMKCSDNPSSYSCTRPCGGIMECCGRTCNSNCRRCQHQNGLPKDGLGLEQETVAIKRTAHVQHPCRKILHCAHLCPNSCSKGHKCATICKERCRQQCPHAGCKEYCSTPCSPCQEPCTWYVTIVTLQSSPLTLLPSGVVPITLALFPAVL